MTHYCIPQKLSPILVCQHLTYSRQQRQKKQDDNKFPAYMFFDFRRGASEFPSNVSIIDPAKAEVLLEKQTSEVLEALKSKKKDTDNDKGADDENYTVNWDIGGTYGEEHDEVICIFTLHVLFPTSHPISILMTTGRQNVNNRTVTIKKH